MPAISVGTVLILGLTLVAIGLNQRFLAQGAELEAVFAASPDPIIVLGRNGAIASLNPAAASLLGAAGAGRSCFDLIDPADHETARAALGRDGAAPPFDLRFKQPSAIVSLWPRRSVRGRRSHPRPQPRE